MAISTSNNSITAFGNGVQTVFGFNFIAAAATNLNVYLINQATGAFTLLSPGFYTVSINAPATGQLWGVGGTITYPISGSPITTGFQLQISRILPLTQVIRLANQGDFLPNVIEQSLDTLEMQIQQLNSRTTQFRGTWLANTAYNVGDIVQDGANGLNTLNYYICQNSNISSVWATDLSAGDWAISVVATVPGGVINVTGAVTGTQVGSTIATTLANNIVGLNNLQTNAVSYNKFQQAAAANVILANPTAAGSTNYSELAIGQNQLVGRGSTGNLSPLTLGANLSFSGTTLNASGGGELILLGTATASNSASLSFTSLITSSYDYYFFIIKDLLFSAANILWMRGSTSNGASYIQTNGFYASNVSAHVNGSTTITVSGVVSSSTVALILSDTSSLSQIFNGKLDLINPLTNQSNANAYWHINDADNNKYYEGYGSFNFNEVNAVQFLPSAGTFTSGTIEMYGVKNT